MILLKTKFKLPILLLAFFLVFSYIGSTAYAGDLPNTTLVYLQRGQAVKEVQIALNTLGYNLKADGSYGPGTRAVVLSFQRKYSSLRNDGSYGPSTKAVMEKALNNIDGKNSSENENNNSNNNNNNNNNNSNNKTLNLPNRTLRYLERGAYVRNVQTALSKLGYKLSIDGSYGPGTRSAILDFQRKHSSLRNDGSYGPATRAVMLMILNGDKPNDNTGGKIAYLTFDDGPSRTNTPQVLKILDRYNIKATFFVLGSMAENQPAIVQSIKSKGHSIGNHTYSHKYNYLYSNLNNFLGEVGRTDKILKNILGNDFNTSLLRFPGGSFGDKKASYRRAARDRGYRIYDWDSLNGDAEALHVPVSRLMARLKETVRGQKEIVVLMHDTYGKETTVEALPQIIEYLKGQGYSFKALDE